jgi:hypothetical protein
LPRASKDLDVAIRRYLSAGGDLCSTRDQGQIGICRYEEEEEEDEGRGNEELSVISFLRAL